MSALSSRPSRETKATTIMKLRTDLATCNPCCVTCAGKSAVAVCSLFWTCIWATSGFVPFSKVRVTVAIPVDSLVEDM